MRVRQGRVVSKWRQGEAEITNAAMRAYGRSLAATGGLLTTHASGDGGLICEHRSRRSRPVMWRILPDGSVLADCRYSYARGTFVTGVLPQGV